MEKKLLNDNWTFRIGISTSFDDMQGVGYGVKPEPVTLPHDAMIHTVREDSKTGAAIAFYKGYNYSYTRKLFLGEEEAGKDYWMEFEGVFQNAYVYVNGALAGRCNYGYGNYYIHLTEFLQFGCENEIIVIVKNEGRGSRWYTGGGIYRDIYLHVGNLLHIACESVKITSTDIEPELAVVETETPLVYRGTRTDVARVRTELLDLTGNLVASEESPITLIPGEESALRQKLFVKNPALWDIDTPNLYECRTTVFLDGEVMDQAVNRFGIRKLQLDIEHGLRINGKTVKLRGGCVHHDLGVIGTATFERSEYRRVKKMKEAGFNAIRTGAHPSTKAMLDACDELGMLLVDEFTDVFDAVKVDDDYGNRFSDFWRLDLSNMVKRDYNHPSVIMYSLGCENSQIANTYNRRLVKQMVDQIREIDTTRYTTNDINLTLIVMGYMADLLAEKSVSIETDVNAAMNNYTELLESLYNHERADEIIEEAVSGMDVMGYNYVLNRYDHDMETYPNRILMATECTMMDLEKTWKYTTKYPQVLGDFCWAGWDYIGEAGVGRTDYEEFGDLDFYAKFPWKLASSGAIDILGNRRTVSYWREMIWGRRTQPYIAVRDPKYHENQIYRTNWAWISDAYASWTWKGCENQPVTVEVMTPADEVELFVNGKSVGKKKTGEEHQALAIFETVYEPGEIAAVDSNGEKFSIQTAGDDIQLNVVVEDPQIGAGEHDVAYVNIQLTDADGILNADAEKKVKVTVEGAGSLQGLGSADPTSTEDFFADEYTTYRGQVQAVIRSGKEAGTITVKVSADGCKEQIVTIQAV